MKANIIKILQILKDYSSDSNHLSQQDIIRYYKSDYHLDIDRRTVKSLLESLSESGYDIITDKSGTFLGGRLITESEIKYLSDIIYSNKAFTAKQANELVSNLAGELPKKQRGKFVHIHYALSRKNHYNKEFFNTMDIISEAQNKKTKLFIEFYYSTYDQCGNEIITNLKYKTKVMPFYTVCDNGKHYLICGVDSYGVGSKPHLSTYRIEFIKNANIIYTDSNEYLQKYQDISYFDKSFKLDEYMSNQTYMHQGQIINAKFKIYENDTLRDIVDWFGENAKVEYNNIENSTYVSVKSSLDGLTYWSLQYSSKVEVIEPIILRNRIYAYAKDIVSKYENVDNSEFSSFNIPSCINDSVLQLKKYNLDKLTKDEYIDNIYSFISDYLRTCYKVSKKNNTITIEQANDSNKKYTININFLFDEMSDEILYNTIKDISDKQDHSNYGNRIYNLYITNRHEYYRGNSELELYKYFRTNIYINNNIIYNGETIPFKYEALGHWSYIKQYNNSEYKYCLVETRIM